MCCVVAIATTPSSHTPRKHIIEGPASVRLLQLPSHTAMRCGDVDIIRQQLGDTQLLAPTMCGFTLTVGLTEQLHAYVQAREGALDIRCDCTERVTTDVMSYERPAGSRPSSSWASQSWHHRRTSLRPIQHQYSCGSQFTSLLEIIGAFGCDLDCRCVQSNTCSSMRRGGQARNTKHHPTSAPANSVRSWSTGSGNANMLTYDSQQPSTKGIQQQHGQPTGPIAHRHGYAPSSVSHTGPPSNSFNAPAGYGPTPPWQTQCRPVQSAWNKPT